MKILDFGSLNLDHVFQVDHFPVPGETLRPEKVSLFPGGKGLNQAVAASRAGSRTCMAGTVGADCDFLLKTLSSAGVDTSLVTVSSTESTGQAIIETDPSGANRILLDPAANEACTLEQIQSVLNHFSSGDLLICQNEISHMNELLCEAKKRSLKILFNPAPMTASVLSFDLNPIDCVAVNETECGQLLGDETLVPEQMIRQFLSRWPDSAVLLTLGSEGAVYAKGSEGCFMPAFKVSVCDTTGAGDTFLGYFADGLARSLSIPEAMQRASAAAALAVQQPGAASSIPDHASTEQFLKDHPGIIPTLFTL